MDEAKMKQIAEEVFTEKLRQTQYGFQSQPYHIHSGTDSPRLPFASIVNTLPLPARNPDGVISPIILDTQVFTLGTAAVDGAGGLLNKPLQSTVYIYPTPIIYGYGVGVHSAFNGGDAPFGTLLCFSNQGTNAQLFIKVDDGNGTGGVWFGFNNDVGPI